MSVRGVSVRGGVMLSLMVVAPLNAQSTRDVRLSRFDAPTRAAIVTLVDSARADGLPTEPLVDKALEGGKKGADGDRIVSAVRGLAAELKAARVALGEAATADEIIAGAGALHAGLQAADLARVGAAARQARRGRVTLPLTIATDLVARGVPVPSATEIVLALARAGVSDRDLALFQRNVRLDIERGANPASAAETRARGAMLRAGRT